MLSGIGHAQLLPVMLISINAPHLFCIAHAGTCPLSSLELRSRTWTSGCQRLSALRYCRNPFSPGVMMTSCSYSAGAGPYILLPDKSSIRNSLSFVSLCAWVVSSYSVTAGSLAENRLPPAL